MNLRAVMLAGIAAVLPVLASMPANAMLQQGATDGRFNPPSQPLLLTRTLWRSLQDGQQIMVRRSYAVQILPDGSGFRVEGRQLDSAVEAPPRLAAIAAAEQNRSDSGGFPMLLNAAGQITYAGDTTDLRGRRQGERALLDMLGQAAMPEHDKTEATSFIRQLITTGGVAAWPRDLFHPTRLQQHEERQLALPDGSEGKVIVAIKARQTMAGGLPEAVERTITTELDGTIRVTREEWALRPL